MTKTKEAPDLLYIMGTGRSGTTILEILLASGNKVSGAGELVHIFRDGYSGEDICSCGQTAAQCPLWSAVWAAGGWREDQVAELADLSRRFSWHSRFPLLATGLVRQKYKDQFSDVNTKLFRAIAKQTATETVVDSSKYAGRALALARYYPGNVKIICLTRSPQGLAAAFSRQGTGAQKPKSPLATLLYYCYALLCFWIVRLILRDNVLMIRYEDFHADPVAGLKEIADWSGIDVDEAIVRLENHQAFQPGHIVTGNRLRHQRQIQFNMEPQRKLPSPRGAGWAVALMRVWRFLIRM